MRRFVHALVLVEGARLPEWRRRLWSAGACLQASPSTAAFLSAARVESAADKAWALDYPRLEKLAAGKDRGSSSGVLGQMGALLATRASSSPSATPVETLELVLSSPESFAAAAAVVKRLAPHLRVLRIHTVSNQREEGYRGSYGKAAWAKGVRDTSGGSLTGMADMTGEVLASLVEGKKQTASTAESVAPLQELELLHLDGGMSAPNYASNGLFGSLTALFSLPPAAVALRSLGLRYIECRHCDEHTVQRLAMVIRASGWAASLECLNLSGSGLILLHLLQNEGLRACGSLRRLDVSNCTLDDMWAPRLLDELRHGIGGWYGLTHLTASGCGVGPLALARMGEQLRAATGFAEIPLTCLDLSANRMGNDAAHCLAAFLPACPNLEELDLRHNELTETATDGVISSLTGAVGLRVLCLRSNRLGPGLAEALATHATCWPALQVLDLTRCRITGAPSMRALARAVASLESLQSLSLSGNDLRVETPLAGDDGGANEKGGSGDDPELKLFAYDQEYMKGDGGGKVPTSFELDRRDRETGRVRYRGPAPEALEPADPFAALGESLSRCRSLQVLDLSDCCLTDMPFTAMMTRMAPAQLQELRVGANALFVDKRGVAVAALVKVLWCCTTTLRVLDLGFTGLGDWGVVTLCDGPLEEDSSKDEERQRGVLPELHALQSLQLPHARITAVGLEALTAAVTALPQLRALVLDGNTARDHQEDADDDAGAGRCTALLEHLAFPEDHSEGDNGEDSGTGGGAGEKAGTPTGRPLSPHPHLQLQLVSLGGCLPSSASTQRHRVSGSPAAQELALRGVQVLV